MAGSPARNTTRHREAAAASRAETRRRLLRAAGEEFAERGYHAATVSRIASRAGVTVQTLYLAWGSKRALLRGHLEAALAGGPDASFAGQVPQLADQVAEHGEADAQSIVEHIAQLYCRVADRAALGWRLYRDAAATDEEVAADWSRLQELRHGTFVQLVARIPQAALRAGLTASTAADTAWALASPETYGLLVGSGRYTARQYQEWITATLTAALLDPAAIRPAAPGRPSIRCRPT